jgi:hypothetical protein
MIDVPRVAASVQSMERSMTLYVAERVRPASPANGDPAACISQDICITAAPLIELGFFDADF